jgi:2',3'-cyclic-nucleotide 2'-phosphodiesterase / 3'-nucleotidase
MVGVRCVSSIAALPWTHRPVITRGTSVFSSQSFAPVASGVAPVHLRLIETTDLHLHLLPWDYFTDRPLRGIGLTAAADLIDAARAEVANALLFDNGDFLQGTPLGDFLAHEQGLKPGQPHPAIAAMNTLGYDAVALGNHEFNYGLDFLMRSLADAACPVLSANLALTQGAGPRADRTLVRPYALLDRQVVDTQGEAHPIRIGVIGLAPPQIVNWDRHLLDGRIVARDIVEAARAWVPEMREAGADIVLALAHTGIGSARHSDGMENAAIPLARVPGIDALMTGHNHLIFPSPLFDGVPDLDTIAGTIAGKPAVMGGCWGAQIGLIDLLLTRDGGSWQVLGARTEVRHASTSARTPARPRASAVPPGSPPAPPSAGRRVTAVVAGAHRAALSAIRQPIGEATGPLHSYFVHLGRTGALALVAQAQEAHVRARLSDTSLSGLPILSSVAPFKCGGRGGPAGYTDVAPGPLALRHVADLYAFPNAIAALRVTGAQVVDWLEHSAAAFNRIMPGSTETLLRSADVAGYHFEVIEPLDVVYDLTRPARYDAAGALVDPSAHRVRQVRFQGKALDRAAEFILCTNSFRLGGAGGFSDHASARVVLSDGRVTRDILRDHIAGQTRVTARPRGRVRFAPIPGTTALFETGPGALAHLDEIAGFAPELRGTTRSGFLRLRIDLSGTAR